VEIVISPTVGARKKWTAALLQREEFRFDQNTDIERMNDVAEPSATDFASQGRK
jgi:hypothetical protein